MIFCEYCPGFYPRLGHLDQIHPHVMAIKRVLGEVNWDTPIRTQTQPNVVEK